MVFTYSEELKKYMHESGRMNIVVEHVISTNSDFEVAELHVYLADDKRARFLEKEHHFTGFATECGRVLLPPYHLVYADTVAFGLRKILFFRTVTQKGISF